MGVDRFFCPEYRVGETSRLEGDEARHLARVRRIPVGALVEVFDGKGGSAVAEVTELGRDRVDLLVRTALDPSPNSLVGLTLVVAIPKRDRFDWLVEKATELGVERIVPILTERSTVDPRTSKLDRLRRAVVESCKQCRRNMLMAIDEPLSWNRYLELAMDSPTKRWVAHPGGDVSWVGEPVHPRESILVAIGPEGGFSDRELNLAHDTGWRSIHLTPTILRIETAALAVASQILLRETADQRI